MYSREVGITSARLDKWKHSTDNPKWLTATQGGPVSRWGGGGSSSVVDNLFVRSIHTFASPESRRLKEQKY